MRSVAYIETSVVSHLTARPSRDVVIMVTNRVHYLVTWNFRHIANAAMRYRIERVCRSAGYEPPVICTPHELMEVSHDDR